jgi:hypothetical protein
MSKGRGRITLEQTAVVEVSKAPVVELGIVNLKRSPSLKVVPEATSVKVRVDLSPTVFVFGSRATVTEEKV